MKILIVGAGRIGSSIAESLVSEANDITIVDMSPTQLAKLKNFDLQCVAGNATSPEVLKNAGAADSDMLIAVTSSDETNLVVSLLCARLFNIPTRIARVRNSELRNYPRILKEEGFQATSIIWPELAVVNYLAKLVEFPAALQVQEFGNGRASLVAVRARAGGPLVGRPVRDLYTHLPDVPARIVALFRRNERMMLSSSLIIEAGDEVISLCDSRFAAKVMNEFRREEDSVKNIVIAGRHNLIDALTDKLQNDTNKTYNITILESDDVTAQSLADKFSPKVTLIHGDFTSEESLKEARVETCDLFIAVSEDDENNILASLLAKRMGAQKTIALINRKAYGDLMQGSQIDVTLSTTTATLGELIRYVRRGDIAAAYSLRRGVAEALEIVAHGDSKSSKVVGRKIKDIRMPMGCTIGAVIRITNDDAQVLMGSKDLEIEAEDHVIVFVPNKRQIHEIEKLFAVDVGFF